MTVVLSEMARQHIAAFEAETGALATDCIESELADRVIFVVAVGDMATAIGPDGETIRAFEAKLGREVALVEDAELPTHFVANALAPAAVYDVEIREEEADGEESDPRRVAYAEVDDADRGVAIGEDGWRIEAATRLANRRFDVEDVQLLEG